MNKRGSNQQILMMWIGLCQKSLGYRPLALVAHSQYRSMTLVSKKPLRRLLIFLNDGTLGPGKGIDGIRKAPH